MNKTLALLLFAGLLTACPQATPPDKEAPRAFVPVALVSSSSSLVVKGRNFDVKEVKINGTLVTVTEKSVDTLKLSLPNPLSTGDYPLEIVNNDGKRFNAQIGLIVFDLGLVGGEIERDALVLRYRPAVAARINTLLEGAGFRLEQIQQPFLPGGDGLCSQVVAVLRDTRGRSVQDALNALVALLGPELLEGDFEPNPLVIQRGPVAYPSPVIPAPRPRAIIPTADYSNANLSVAVLDTGVSNHPEFIYPPRQTVSKVIDYSRGRNFTLEGSGLSDVRDLRTGFLTENEASNRGHGTGVAAVIAAPPNNQEVQSVASKVSVVPIKVCDKNGNCPTPSLVAGVCYAASLADAPSKPVRVLNLSVGGTTPNRLLYLALRDAARSGVSVVVSAGNKGLAKDGNPTMFPAAYSVDRPGHPAIPGLMAVGSVYDQDGIIPSGFSSSGPYVSLVAPGEYIYLPESSDLPGGGTSGPSYGSFTGTSFAAPHVAGMAVRVRVAKPGWTPAEVKTFLLSKAIVLEGCPTNKCGAGLLNVTTLP